MRTRLGLGGSIALAVLAMLALTAGAVLGHAELESSDPDDGATIMKTPYTLTATFDEELAADASSIKVEDASGKEVATGAVSADDDKQMTIELPLLPDGEYTVLWTAVTADDNGVTRDTYTFNVGSAAPTPAATAATPTAGPTAGPTGSQASAAASAPAATPQASSATGSTSGGGNDLLIALVLAAIIIAAVVGFVLYRNRR